MNTFENDDRESSKRTLLAVVLSVLFVFAVSIVQTLFFSPPVKAHQSQQTAVQAPVQEQQAVLAGAEMVESQLPVEDEYQKLVPETITLDTDYIKAVFTNEGGSIVSLQLKKHLTDGKPVEMLVPAEGPTGFGVIIPSTQGKETPQPQRDLMKYERISDTVIEFSRVYHKMNKPGAITSYTLKKRYEFVPDEYFIKLSIIHENTVPQPLAIGNDESAYTVYFGPQIGPDFTELTSYSDFRRIVVLEGTKRKVLNTKNGTITQNTRFTWAGIAGKYFSLIVIPDATQYGLRATNIQKKGVKAVTSMSFVRPPFTASAQADTFYVYIGPKNYKELARYDDPAKNYYKHSADNLTKIMEGNNALGWLESALKWLLNLFYSIIPNYGIAIILLTILVRVILVPLTIKSSKSTAKMQEIQPKIQELQNKYKNNPQKLNIELAELYKKEGANPLSGCLPVLLQFPIFIAMYSLFSNHFDLRGASFIPGWITDLSLPEAIVSFNTIDLFIWKISAIRALPIIYLLSQLWYGKFMQQPTSAGQNQSQMNFMLYGLPIIFFFVLYDAPSGLLVYWIVANILTVIQQYLINRFIHKKNAGKPAKPAIARVK